VRANSCRPRKSQFELLEPRMMLAFTTLSPTSAGELPSGVTVVGGVVLDLIGKNGVRVVSELKATDTFKGYYDDGTPTSFRGNPGTIGIQQGFDASLISALGGGLSEVAVRITLYDGDTGPGDFDQNENWLLLNNARIGNFSDVVTHKTDANGVDATATATKGFVTNTLDTGFFYSNDHTFLDPFYQSLSQGTVTYQLDDSDPNDNYFDFTQGVDASLIDRGQGPTVTYSLVNDSATTQSGKAVAIPVVANDTLPQAIANFAGLFVVDPPAHGAALIDRTTGTITYAPDTGFFGTDAFTYNFSDPGTNLKAATVQVNVAQIVNPFTAVDDVVNATGNFTDINVLANDVVPPGTTPADLVITEVPTHGTLKIAATTGLVRYTPIFGFVGSDIFQYRVANLSPGVDTATVFVAVSKPIVIIVDDPSTTTTDTTRTPIVDPTNGSLGPPLAVINQQLLLLTLPPPKIMVASVPVFGASGTPTVTKQAAQPSFGMPQVVDAAFGSDEVDKTALLTNFLDFVEPEALVVDLGDEPPAKISVDVSKAAAVEVLKPTEPTDKSPTDGSSDQSHSGDSANQPGATLTGLEKSPEDKTIAAVKPVAGTSLSSSLANNWKLLATGAGIVLLLGSAWTSRSKWIRAARKLRWR
jgi:hypothetical protein